MEFDSKIKTIEWKNNTSKVIDQTKLPYEFKIADITTCEQMYNAIKNMIVRGAPAIGIAGAHGVALAALELSRKTGTKEDFLNKLNRKAEYLKSARPTAVNLMWAIDKQMKLVGETDCDIKTITEKLIKNGVKLENEDIEINKKIGEYGAQIVPKGAGILTHCNAGALATVGYGTALGVIRSAYAKDSTIKVFADETRPRQQGARLTTWELVQDGIPVTLITDGMCSYLMSKGMINMVVTGADRIAANGDSANKIGTYTVAIAAKYHNIPFYIAAPLSTIDISIESGDKIPIEERSHDEVTHINGERICAEGVNIINPGFDVTPNGLISGIITEKGILKPNYKNSIAQAMSIILR
ncbi:MAG: S-methyl-5-thioribose-1-phosphate isomerase [Candidatus Gastranaerophilales bacterium]|nr:S-methyl-5-thioribose-1-phosphate isomerase [Candidatus Gastranaerophilales bacterium]